MKYENFIDFFSNIDADNSKIISRWEEISKRKKRVSSIVNIIVIILDILILYKLKTLSLYVIVPIFIMDIFIVIMSQILVGNGDVIKFNNDYKEDIINKLLANFVDELDYIPLKSMPSEIYDEADYEGYYNEYSSDDYFEGKICGQKIIMADLLVEEETTEKDMDGNEEKKSRTVFNGLFGKINLNKSINCNLKITRDYGFSSNEQKVEIDSNEFEKIFNVYSNNNIITMQLLTADIQEAILELYNKYKIDFYIFIKNDKMYILFNTESMFEVFSIQHTPTEVLEKYFEIMKFVYKLVEKMLTTIEDTPV